MSSSYSRVREPEEGSLVFYDNTASGHGTKTFTLKPDSLATMVLDGDHRQLDNMGGVANIAECLGTNPTEGLPMWEIEEGFRNRKNFYGENIFPEPQSKSFLGLFWEALQDTTLVILSGLALLSLVMRMTLGNSEDKKVGWIEPVAILVAVLIVATVTAANDWSKERQFRKLNKVKEDRQIKTIRANKQYTVSIFNIQVGDVVVLDNGDTIPGDGLFLEGHNLRIDTSNLNGEAVEARVDENNPFLLSGCLVQEGDAKMMVVAVGMHSQWGKLIAASQDEAPETPLQTKLDTLAKQISKAGFAFAMATLGVLIISWIIRLATSGGFSDFDTARLSDLVDYVMIAVTIIAVAVPEGLPLAVTISLAYSMRKMMFDNNLVRHLSACETMGGATNICSDKTGTLTENRMTCVKAWIAGKSYIEIPPKGELGASVVENLCEGIALNSKAHIGISPETRKVEYQGSKTECALLLMIQDKWDHDFLATRTRYHDRHAIRNLYSFSSLRKRMSTFVALDNGSYRLYCKGAAEVVVELCDTVLNSNGVPEELPASQKQQLINSTIKNLAREGLRTISVAYRDFPTYEASFDDPENAPEEKLTLVGIFGIMDPLRPEVPDAVRRCQEAGVTVRMVTGDNLDTAVRIATECGILTGDGVSMEGREFRQLEGAELHAVLPRLQVLARSTPVDKLKLVKSLHELGEVVAVTGDGTNDAPALKAADVGLAMGLSGTEVAKEASDIIILDDNFKSIVNAVLWGRSVYENIRKFLQFQLTVNVVALVLTLIASLAQREALPLTAIQLLWVNLIMDTFAALALATEPPNPDLLKRKPYGRYDHLITSIMLRNILGQSVFQLTVLLIFTYAGPAMFGLHPDVDVNKKPNDDMYTLNTIIFNVFVLMQLFNEFNARKVNNEANVFENLSRSFLFVVIVGGTFLAQILIVEFGGKQAASTVPLSFWHWVLTTAVGALSMPVGYLLRYIPVKERKPNVPKEVMKRRAGSQTSLNEAPYTDEDADRV